MARLYLQRTFLLLKMGLQRRRLYFNPFGLSRTNSIYSLSRVSFNNQLSQLTSLKLPQASSLSASISAIPTAPAAVKALIGAAEQMQRWIQKAKEVLGGLNAEDDIEWAAAGREGLDDVDTAVSKFESLVGVYVQAIEELQLREDIADTSAEGLELVVLHMEKTLKEWEEAKSLLRGVKEQVELAMEWEELWSVVLGDVGMELDNLSRVIFEMEEKRHKTITAEVESTTLLAWISTNSRQSRKIALNGCRPTSCQLSIQLAPFICRYDFCEFS